MLKKAYRERERERERKKERKIAMKNKKLENIFLRVCVYLGLCECK